MSPQIKNVHQLWLQKNWISKGHVFLLVVGGGWLDSIKDFSLDYLSCKRRAVKNKVAGPLCCCSRAGIRRPSVWAALHPHCPKAGFLIILMRERCSDLRCRDAAYTQEQPYLHCTYNNLTALIKEQKIKPLKASIDQPWALLRRRCEGLVSYYKCLCELFHQKKRTQH